MKGKNLNADKPVFVIHSSDLGGEQKTIYGHDRIRTLNTLFKDQYDVNFLFSSTPFRNNNLVYSVEAKSFRKMRYEDIDLYLTGVVGKLFMWEPQHTVRAVKVFRENNGESKLYSLDLLGLIGSQALLDAGADKVLNVPNLDVIVYNGTCCIGAEHPLRIAGSIAQGEINNALSGNNHMRRYSRL